MAKSTRKPRRSSPNGKPTPDAGEKKPLLIEIAWEVANQEGGIYTVIRSKVPAARAQWGDDYLLIGPYTSHEVSAVFDPVEPGDDALGRAVVQMRERGHEVHMGTWLITGRPRVVLLNPFADFHRLGEIKYQLWERHHIQAREGDALVDKVIAFGYLVREFLRCLHEQGADRKIIAHFHEWMGGTAIPDLRYEQLPIQTVFTTHATLLGRYLASNTSEFYRQLPFFDWEKEARHFDIETPIRLERAAAHGAHVFSTVSEVTSRECERLIGRKPDLILPNGLNLKRYAVSHEVQIQHQAKKEEIHEFTKGHFFQSYPLDLDNTLYFFTSGRYEYSNKGYDLTLEALAKLNWRMKQAGVDKTVVMFFITKRPFHSINPDVLQSRATLEKIRQTCASIQGQVGEALFREASVNEKHKFPDLNGMVDDYWKLRLRRTVQSWKTDALPKIVTHNLIDEDKDQILAFLRKSFLLNYREDKVKVVYHPDFLSSTSPLFNMEYGDFVKGCHLGIFPSYYEPWGYTPLECLATGVPAVTSDLAGFGHYAQAEIEDLEEKGIYLVHRNERSFDEAANELADLLFGFVKYGRTDRIAQRYRVVNGAELFGWKNLYRHYQAAYARALEGAS